MKTFKLNRIKDFTGVSGLGIIAEGAIFTDGKVVLKWVVSNKPSTITIYDNLTDLMLLHNHVGTNHSGGTEIIFD